MWLRICYAEYVGTRFTRDDVRSHVPVVLLNLGSTALFGVFLGASVVDESLPLALLSGSLFLVLLFFGVTGLRMLIGYFRTDRYPVMVDLRSDAGPQSGLESDHSPAKRVVLWSEPSREPTKRPFFDWLESRFWIAFLWIGAALIWVVVAALLYGLMVGEFPQVWVPAE